MKTKRSIVVTALITLTVLLGTTTAWSVLASLTPPPVMPGGAYTGVHSSPMGSDLSEMEPAGSNRDRPDEPLLFSSPEAATPTPPPCKIIAETVTPLDPMCDTMAFTYRCDTQDPTLGCTCGPPSGADHLTDFVGNMVRTSWNTWDYTAVAYGTKANANLTNPELVYIVVVQGTATYSSDGNTKVAEGTVAVYGPGQDADNDGLPDEGQVPSYHCGSTCSTQVTRVPVLISLEPAAEVSGPPLR